MLQTGLWLCPILLPQVHRHTNMCVRAGEPSPNTLMAAVTTVKLSHISMLCPYAQVAGCAVDLVL